MFWLAIGAQNEDEGLLGIVAFSSGLGWAVSGRWDIGFVVCLARILMLVPLLALVSLMGLNSDCTSCAQWPFYAAFGVWVGIFVLMTLASAYFVARSPARPGQA